MDNNFSTGNPKVDALGLVIAWGFALFSWQTLPIIMSCAASALVILNQVIIFKNRKKK